MSIFTVTDVVDCCRDLEIWVRGRTLNVTESLWPKVGHGSQKYGELPDGDMRMILRSLISTHYQHETDGHAACS